MVESQQNTSPLHDVNLMLRRETGKMEVNIGLSTVFYISDDIFLGVRTGRIFIVVISKDDKHISIWVPTVINCTKCFKHCVGKDSEAVFRF